MTAANQAGWRMPAEWEPHAATWLAWPRNADDFPTKLTAVQRAFALMTAALAHHETVRILVESDRHAALARKQLREADVPLDAVELVFLPTDRSWVRDSLPLFTVAHGTDEVRAVKFRFNAWARYPDHRLDERAGQRVAALVSDDVVRPSYRPRGAARDRRVVLEGGSIDVDGEGTLLATEQCLLGDEYPRNPGLGRRGTERLLRKTLGAQHVIWLPRGIAGDDTSGHVDDFARFVRPGVVLLCREPKASDENHATLEEAREHLESARDAAGRRLEIVRLPMPEPVVFRKERLPASYANFYVSNSLVLVPTYGDANDEQALGIVAEAFPDRRVEGIPCRELVIGLGAIHCSTMQQPRPPRGAT